MERARLISAAPMPPAEVVPATAIKTVAMHAGHMAAPYRTPAGWAEGSYSSFLRTQNMPRESSSRPFGRRSKNW